MRWKSAMRSSETAWDEIDGVLVSDFITPSWFEPTQADRIDFKKRRVETDGTRPRRICFGSRSGERLDPDHCGRCGWAAGASR